jgi:hypothetical protein
MSSITEQQWQERELHCRWFGHTLSGVLRREPLYRAMSPVVGQADDQPRGVPHIEVRRCECCCLEFREPKNTTE